jgi:hypothetical protein
MSDTGELARLVHNAVIDGKVSGVKEFSDIIADVWGEVPAKEPVLIGSVVKAIENCAKDYELIMLRKKR